MVALSNVEAENKTDARRTQVLRFEHEFLDLRHLFRNVNPVRHNAQGEIVCKENLKFSVE